jgi:hypothetical protein
MQVSPPQTGLTYYQSEIPREPFVELLYPSKIGPGYMYMVELSGKDSNLLILSNFPSPELVFTKLTLQILYWISNIVIHGHVFILDLPAIIDV